VTERLLIACDLAVGEETNATGTAGALRWQLLRHIALSSDDGVAVVPCGISSDTDAIESVLPLGDLPVAH
jgi:hypothetical protein